MTVALSPSLVLLVSVLVSLLLVSSSSPSCPKHRFTSKRHFSSCVDLPSLHTHLHWNYLKDPKELEIAFRARVKDNNGWVSWGINPNGTGMVGTEAIVAFRNSYDGNMTAYTTLLTSYSPSMLPEDISFQVANLSAEYSNNEVTIFAILSPVRTRISHVWQVGSVVSDNIPQMHSLSLQNLRSSGHLNLLSRLETEET